MKEILKNPLSWGYSAPAIEVIELNVEGSICQASQFDPAGWQRGENDWFE